MNEDEAFIRAIVDNPGEDTARLVYADWLDDRDDPRGAYLREEFEWAKPWRSDRRPRDNSKLRKLATGLDPVWAARISRPPVGVCCEHVRFTASGPNLDLSEIACAEHRLAGTFSTDYRAFLLNYNGGTPDRPALPYPVSLGWDDLDLVIRRFYTASRRGEAPPRDAGEFWGYELEGERAWLEELYQMGDDRGPNPLIAGMVPFAETISDLGYFLLGIGPDNNGRVYHFRDYTHHNEEAHFRSDYAATFAEFLAQLRDEQPLT